MTTEETVRMANQIAAFYGPYPHDEGVAGVLAHIKDVWEPRMKRELKAYVAGGGAGLEPLVLEAAAKLG